MRKRPGFTLAVVLTLSIGIGANSAMFSIVNGVLLQPLPYPDADRLVVVNNSYPGLGAERTEVSIPDYLDRRDGVPAFEESALWHWTSAGITTGSTPDHYSGLRTTRTLFPTLRTAPLIGRNFTEEEMQPGKDKVVILSYPLWQELFAGSRDAVGRDLRIDGVTHDVVGIMPEGFAFPNRNAEYFVPFAFTSEQMSDAERGDEFAGMLARLAPGATSQQAHAQMQAIFANLEGRFPEYQSFFEQAGLTTRITGLHDERVDGAETPLLLLQLCVAFVLLIVCANIANLFLTRMIARQRELSVRAAIGAGRVRITRQLLTESLLLSLLGGVGGVLLAYAGLDVLRAAGLLSASSIFEIDMDASVLIVTLSITLGAGILFGLFSMAAAWRSRTVEVLKEGGHGTSGGRGARWSRSALVVAQVTLAVALLVSAGLLMRSFTALQSVDPGFNVSGVLTARISLPESRYPDAAAVQAFQQRLDRTLDGLPGVTATAMTQAVPFGHSSSSGSYSIRGMQAAAASTLHSNRLVVSGDYFKAMQIDLLEGRSFDETDAADSRPVIVIDDVLARKYFPDSDPLGRQITFDIGEDDVDYWTVVGVAERVKLFSLDESEDKESIYLPLSQTVRPEFYVVLRSPGDPDVLIHPLRDAIQRLDPELPAYDVASLHARIDDSLHRQRMPMTLLAVFAGIALLLAAIGLYGVLAYSVAQRTGEIGVRMALGADRFRVMKLVLRQGSRLVFIGLVLGLVLALLLGAGLRSLLYGVGAADPLVYLTAVALLSLIALAACAIPSWRAARINPIDALREE